MNEFTSKRLNAEELACELQKISGNVSGFYRLSDAEEPVLLHNEPLLELPQNTVPFLYEAAFFNGSASVMIRQYNDFWIFNFVKWDEVPPRKPEQGSDFLVYRQYTRSREKLLFYTQYLPEDSYGFKVLKPAWNAFIDFAEEV